MRRLLFYFYFVIALSLTFQVCEAVVVSPDLQGVLQAAPSNEEVPVIINLADKVDISKITFVTPSTNEANVKALKRKVIVDALKTKAGNTHGPLTALLQARGGKKIEPLWITNSIAVTVPASVIGELMSMPEIESIVLDAVIQAPLITSAAAVPPQWNITQINAPALWSAGIDGRGAVVASFDTGVDVNHPDLKYRWRGGSCSAPPYCPSWFDPYNNTTLPYGLPATGKTFTELDSIHAHGTITMGIMVGGVANPLGNAIGVAPGARWISAKIFDDTTGNSTTSVILRAFQWALCPGCDPANLGCICAPSPDVVNNSWTTGLQNTCDTTFEAAISNLTIAGIEVVFAAGNMVITTPPTTSSSSFSPANNAGVFAVGATDITNVIAPFSALGPSACSDRITNFPNVVAPGSDIYSSVPTGGNFTDYAPSLSGTSISAPHVSGAAALLADAMPTLTPAQIETAFEQSTLTLGSPRPNDTYGYGLLDAKAAYQYAFTNFGKGLVPQIAGVPSSVFFINSSSNAFTLVIVNQGTADLTISGLSFTGTNSTEFAITSDTCSGNTITSLSNCSVSVTFSPGAPGPRSAQLSIASNVATLNVPLSGNDPIARVQDASFFRGRTLVSAHAIVATYSDIQTASNDCSNWDIIQMQAGPLPFPENPVFNLPLGISVNLLGGYDPAFASQAGFTTINGTLTISRGTVTVGNVIVH